VCVCVCFFERKRESKVDFRRHECRRRQSQLRRPSIVDRRSMLERSRMWSQSYKVNFVLKKQPTLIFINSPPD